MGQLRKEKRHEEILYRLQKPNGFCDHLTTDAIDESDARRQFYELYEGMGYEILCVAQI